MSIVLGTQLYAARSDENERQVRSGQALAGLHDVVPVNLQWSDGVIVEQPGLRTVRALRRDVRLITRHAGGRKPIASEAFDVLANLARGEGHPYFGWLNADIVVTQPVVELVLEEAKQTYAFSRTDVDERCAPVGLMLYGMDLFVAAVEWWTASRRRFRPYIIGERCYDNVYTAIMMCHGDGLVVNRQGYLLHVQHATAERVASPYGQYNRFLASLDSRYFSMWVEYCKRLVEARRRGASEAEERAIADEEFVWRTSAIASVRHVGRQVKAHLRYWRQRAVWERAPQRVGPGATF